MADPNAIPLDIIVLDNDVVGASAVKAAFESVPGVRRVRIVNDLKAARKAFEDDESNALLIDIFSLPYPLSPSDGAAFIQHVRTNHPRIPICLLGSAESLTRMPGLSEKMSLRFRHYFELAKDQQPKHLFQKITGLVTALADYIFAQDTLAQVSEIRNLIVRDAKALGEDSPKRERIARTLADAEVVIARQADSRHREEYRIGPIQESVLQELVEDTLSKASQTIRLTSFVNLGVLALGSLVVVVAVIKAWNDPGWPAVALGGIGMSGLITALISNPLGTIALGARRIVQVQMAYLGFINQIAILKNPEDEAGRTPVMDLSRRLQEVVQTMIVDLTAHF